MKRVIIVVALVFSITAYAADKPLKIYILAGQSNMQGMASPSTLPHMTLDPATKALHDKMVDAKGQPRVHEDIYITAVSHNGTSPTAKEGQLTIGFGGDLEDNKLGLELAFGVTTRELVGQPILLIKTAWGGKSLYTQFRPPSAGERPVTPESAEKWKKAGNYDEELEKHKQAGGHFYRLMEAHIKKVLADPGKYHPAYDPEVGYEVAGFAWFQGFNDKFEPYRTLPKPEGARRAPKDFSEYSRLLACFIRDVRKLVKTPDMPFAIGVMGIGGVQEDAPYSLRACMAAPAEMPEFKGTVFAIDTGKFWDHQIVESSERDKELRRIKAVPYAVTREGKIDYSATRAKGWQSVGTPPLDTCKWRYVTFTRDREKVYRPLKEGEPGDERFFIEDVPDQYAGWQKLGFDARTWQEGPAPIGSGPFYERGKTTVGPPQVHSKWGEGNMLLMRTTITLDDPAAYEDYRVCIMAERSYNIYLNGQKVAHYVWWGGAKRYTAFYLTGEQLALLKKGDNVLAVQANRREVEGKKSPNWVDLRLEGITKQDNAKLHAFYDTVCSPKDREIARGRSNQEFHYLGSSKIYSRIGEALAKAMGEVGRE